MKIVLDTNVLIDGFKDEYSYEKRIIDEVRKGNIEAFANRETLRENKFITGKIIQNPEYQRELDEFFAQINWVINKRQVRAVSDPEDNKILESAVEAKADYLISSDNALLELKKYKHVRIVTPVEFWSKYKDQGDSKWLEWINFVKHN
ncbi:MAG: putative toxin-antitoxin system toxin component, PIN family [Patescibacteria group bacterium]